MDKPILRKIEHIKEFLELWVKFHQMYKSALNKQSITPEEEDNFLQTKSLIARRYQTLMDELEIKPTMEDRTMDVIGSILSLDSVSNISDMQLKKLENDWHNSFLLLNRFLGKLEADKSEARKTSSLAVLKEKFLNILLVILLFTMIFLIAYIIANFLRIKGILK